MLGNFSVIQRKGPNWAFKMNDYAIYDDSILLLQNQKHTKALLPLLGRNEEHLVEA